MKTIATANQKGGVGKTTTVRNLAFSVIERDLHVLCASPDPQKNFSKTFWVLRERTVGDQGDELQSLTDSTLLDGEAIELQPLPYEELAVLVAVDHKLVDVASCPLEDLHALRVTLTKLARDFDVCIIDMAPTLESPLYVALIAADFVACLYTVDQSAIDGLGDLFKDTVRVQQLKWNADLATLDLLTNRANTRRTFDRNALEQLRGELGEVVMERVLYDHATTQYAKDRPVWRV